MHQLEVIFTCVTPLKVNEWNNLASPSDAYVFMFAIIVVRKGIFKD